MRNTTILKHNSKNKKDEVWKEVNFYYAKLFLCIFTIIFIIISSLN